MTTAREIAAFLGKVLHGEDFIVRGVSDRRFIEKDTLVFFRGSTVSLTAESADVRALLLIREDAASKPVQPYIETDNPRRDFALASQKFFPVEKEEMSDWLVRPGVVIESNVLIGGGTELGNYTVLKSNTTVGTECKIGDHTVIGTPGFGIEYMPNGSPFRIPHRGGVTIGCKVEIGALCSIARGTIRDTVIGDNVFIDDHVFIAHNVVVEECSLIIAHAEISGSVHIGKCCWIGPRTCIREGLTIGDGALVGIGSVVVKDVEPGAVVAGNPAKFMRWRNADSRSKDR